MAMAPVPTPEILWRQAARARFSPPPGRHSATSARCLPRRRRRGRGGCRRPDVARRRCRHGQVGASTSSHRTSPSSASGSVANDVLPADVVTRNRRLAETALRPWTPAFIHGDLQVDHVFVAGDEITGVVDWSEASQGDAPFDLATLTLGHQEHLGDVVAGYGTDVDRDLIRGWSLRCLSNVRWLAEHGFGPPERNA